jgi:hypothetical protein
MEVRAASFGKISIQMMEITNTMISWRSSFLAAKIANINIQQTLYSPSSKKRISIVIMMTT